MKKSMLFEVIMGVSVSLMFSSSAYSSPFDFEVTVPWSYMDVTDSFYYNIWFGTEAVLKITVDNGNSSEISQSYTWANIQSIVFTTNDVHFPLIDPKSEWGAGPFVFLSLSPWTVFLITDGQGYGSIRFDSGTTPSSYFRVYAGDFEVGIYDDGDPIRYSVWPYYDEYAVVHLDGPTVFPAALLSGPPVPEPTSMFLFGTGIAGLIGTGLRRIKIGKI